MKTHPYIQYFHIGNTAAWRSRERIRKALKDIVYHADEASLCLDEDAVRNEQRSSQSLWQASKALHDLDKAIKDLKGAE